MLKCRNCSLFQFTAYREHKKAYTKSLRDTRSRFYSGIINNSSGNTKQLFSTINHLLKPQAHPRLEATKERCDTFIMFFRKKVDTIRSFLSSSSALPVLTADLQPETPQLLCCFSDISQREVEDRIRKMKPSTCTLDLFPTALVKSNLLRHKSPDYQGYISLPSDWSCATWTENWCHQTTP